MEIIIQLENFDDYKSGITENRAGNSRAPSPYCQEQLMRWQKNGFAEAWDIVKKNKNKNNSDHGKSLERNEAAVLLKDRTVKF